MLEMDAANITTGVAYAQTATSFAASDYALNLTGENPNGEVDDIAQFDTTSATSSNMTGVLDENNIRAARAHRFPVWPCPALTLRILLRPAAVRSPSPT